MPILAFVGDTHYQFYSMYKMLVEFQERTGILFDGIIQIGDFGVDQRGEEWNYLWNTAKEVEIPTWVCMGNHEDYASIDLWNSNPDRIINLHLLPDGGITNVCGINVGSVWGNYSPKSYANPQRIIDARRNNSHTGKANHIYKPSVDRLLSMDGPMDVLITHDCPSIMVPKGFSGRPIPREIVPILGLDKDESMPGGCPGFSQLLDKFHPKYYYFGHFHTKDTRLIGKTRITCLQAFDYDPENAVEIVEF